jgi:hypothetical protein
MARANSLNSITASVTDAHAHPVQRVITNKSHHMHARLVADALDFERRAEHLRRLLTAVSLYVDTAPEDIARSSNIEIDCKYLIGYLEDFTADVCGTLKNAAERIQSVVA